jgi:hypothetical protein
MCGTHYESFSSCKQELLQPCPHLQHYLEGEALVYQLLLLEVLQHGFDKLQADDVVALTIHCSSSSSRAALGTYATCAALHMAHG